MTLGAVLVMLEKVPERQWAARQKERARRRLTL
jgi:hypothetical protein